MDMSADFIVRKRLDEAEVVPWTVPIIDVHLYYWPHDNLVTDDKGEVIFNPFAIISPNDFAMKKEKPYLYMYFTHLSDPNKIVGISYQDPEYFEAGDYKRYPTMKDQMRLREQELSRFDDQLDEHLSNFEYRRKIYPELYI